MRTRSSAPWIAATGACLLAATGAADVVTDGSLGPKVRLSGPAVAVGHELGRTRGRNLFHSFARFDVATGQQVVFTGPDGLDRVISRVTGGVASSIDGFLRSRVPGADVYLLNPSGILFGPNAVLDVPAAFHASTADALRFGDGAELAAGDPTTSGLSVAAPEAFGFLGATPSPIAVDGAFLRVRPGMRLSLVGGDVAVRGGSAGLVIAQGGRVDILGVGGPGSADLTTGEITAARRATIRLDEAATVMTSGLGGGTVRIRGGRIELADEAFVLADNLGPSDGMGGVLLEGERVSLTAGALITSDALSSGASAGVRIAADELGIRSGAAITSSSFGAGDGGTVRVQARRVLVAGDGAAEATGIASQAGQLAGGDAGAVAIDADLVELRDGGAISGGTFGIGRGAPVTIRADEVLLTGGGSGFTGIESRANAGSGDAGPVAIIADRLVVGDGAVVTTGTASAGAGAALDLRAEVIELRRGGLLTGGTSGIGAGGTVRVAAGRLTIAGDGAGGVTGIANSTEGPGDAGAVVARADRLELRDGGAITSSSVGSGGGGSVRVVAGELDIRSAGGITSSAFARGDAGSVRVEAGRLVIDGAGATLPTGIASQSDRPATGSAGNVRVVADDIEIRSGGAITSGTLGPGAGGIVAVDAGSVEIAGNGAALLTGIASNAAATATAPAGAVTVGAERLHIRAGGVIGSTNLGTGDAGSVRIAVADRLELDTGLVTTESRAAGGGRIVIRAGEMLRLERGSRIASSVQGDATTVAGDVATESRLVVLNRGGAIVAQANEGRGGNIRVTAGRLVASIDSAIDASAATGIDGTVVTSSPEVDLTSGLVVLPTVFLGVDRLLQASCDARRSERVSSFIAAGRGGLPASPEQPLAAGYRLSGMVAGAGTPPGDGCRR
jgi:filamentous hemagglutinin family protein